MAKEKVSKLHINDVKASDRITVIAMMDNKKIELPAKFAELTEEERGELSVYGKNILAVEGIVQEKEKELYIVSFTGHVSVLESIVINEDGVFKFDYVQIKKHELKSGKVIHVIVAINPEGKRYNRRRGIRINLDTSMTIEQGEQKFVVLVRDMSYCGVGFVNLSPEEIDRKKPFILNLVEKDEDKSFTVGKFIGKVHRVYEQENGSTTYGCIIAEKHAEFLQRYIALKQMEAINGKKAFNSLQKTSENENWRADVASALNELLTEDQINK